MNTLTCICVLMCGSLALAASLPTKPEEIAPAVETGAVEAAPEVAENSETLEPSESHWRHGFRRGFGGYGGGFGGFGGYGHGFGHGGYGGYGYPGFGHHGFGHHGYGRGFGGIGGVGFVGGAIGGVGFLGR